ncbi:peptide chain release factor N(5)-glutamine methyltransferase [Maritimibacter sp. HL-12]|uniref:peptide chain release factor N(5)-glutamine methyltransferase n=1 Tax=Maritimibacter sp. HL-12 TaxID=1162418 RepID=UPI000A0F39AE|nr:peptide chain release factor N(5)-glutamine methyltransferase [Maritimibacter sp. HL-12]SMH57968.1 [protein release factor]-glutamine N5-methyltransferase [Maritimibacter sp. HL-12]
MRLTQALGKGTGLLGFGGMGTSGRDSRALLAHALGIPADRLTLHADREVSEEEMARYEALLHRRLEHEPVSRIIGRRMFWGRNFRITPHVLDPRPETETLVAEALAGPAPARLLDLGTGSGILAITLLAEWAQAEALASDVSPEALIVARSNAEDLGVADRLTLIEADWFSGIDARFELIVSNPPYIAAGEMDGLDPEVREHDPEIALTPGGDGLDAYRAIAAGAGARLAPGGRLLVEIGPTQGAQVAALLRAAGLVDVEVLPDLDGRDRVVRGARK